MVIQEAYSQRPIADNPIPVVLWRQPHWLTPESLAEVDLIPSPLDLSVGADLPHRHSDLVVRSRYPAGIGPERRTVPIPRTGLPQSLMRPLFIVAVAKGVKGSLLPSSVRLRRRSRLCLQRPVQPLQPSVLFRVAGLDSLRNDAQLDPPYCQLRQAPKTNACKGRSVVASDRLGQSILPESALKDSLYLRPSGLRKPVADQQVPRGGVLHGERVYANAVAGAEPPFEVDGPNVVGVVRRGKGLAPRCRVPSPFPSTHQPSSVQYVPCRAGRRPTHSWLDPSKRCHHLLRPPRWMGLLGPDQPLGYRPRRLIGMTMRSSATVSQPTPPTRPESLEPPVARLTTYAELAARLYQRHSPSLTLFNEPYLFVFRARLFPGQHIPPDRFAPIFVQCVTHVPGFSVTNVPGLYPPQSSPIEGEEVSLWPRSHVPRQPLKPAPTASDAGPQWLSLIARGVPGH